MSLTALAFVLLFFAGIVMAFARHPVFGLYTYMLTFYAAPGDSWWSADLPDLRWSLLAAAVTFIAVSVHGSPPQRRPWHSHASARILIALSVWLWIQTPWALSLQNHLFLATLFTKYVVMYAIVYAVAADERHIRGFAMAHVLGCFYWGFLAWANPGSGRLEDIGTSDVAGSAFASMHVSTAVAVAGFLFLGVAGWRRWVMLLAIPFILNAIVLMATRGAFVGLVAAVPAALYMAPGGRRALIAGSSVLGGVLLLMLAHDFFWERMATIVVKQDGQMEESAASRFGIAGANLQMFVDHPYGVGHRGNDILSPRYMPPELLTDKDGEAIRSAHNTVMAILVDHSIIGLLLVVMLHAQIVRAILRLRRLPDGTLSPAMFALCSALGTALVIYWCNAQFANMTKTEVVIWIAALAAALEALPKSGAAAPDNKPRLSRTAEKLRRLRPS
jgi:hypothetical protein